MEDNSILLSLQRLTCLNPVFCVLYTDSLNLRLSFRQQVSYSYNAVITIMVYLLTT